MPSLVLKYNQAVSLMFIMTAVKLSGVRNIQRGRCLRLLKTECEDFEKERQRLLLEEHCEIGEDGKPVELPEGLRVKSGKSWNEALQKLIKGSPVEISIATDADRAWLSLCKEVMTTKICPELAGEPAMDFEDVLDAVTAAIVEPKKEAEPTETAAE